MNLLFLGTFNLNDDIYASEEKKDFIELLKAVQAKNKLENPPDFDMMPKLKQSE